jgi:hypothetical protein
VHAAPIYSEKLKRNKWDPPASVCQAVLANGIDLLMRVHQLLFELADKLADELSRLLFIIHEGVARSFRFSQREFGSILKCKSAPRNYLI